MSHRRHNQEASKRRRHTFDFKEGQQTSIVSKNAFVFLCLFDGFRIPSIRRLTRKPRSICFEPLLDYNPWLSSPATKNAIDGRYESLLHVNCNSIIDPSISQVNSLISRTFSRPINERLIIHYFGQGSIQPSKAGQIFFFDSNHHSYRGLSISKVIGSVSAAASSKILAPVALILDVNSAGALIPELTRLVESKSANLIAFLSCDDNETLPSAPSLPNDILSSSILFPSKMAVWFHAWRSSFNSKEVSTIFAQSPNENLGKYTEVSSNESFFTFLNSVIDSIAFSKLDQVSYEKYIFEDPSLATITRGFILAQRILRYHNIHAKSVPDLPDFTDSELWAYLDLVLDMTFSEDNYSFSIMQGAFDQLSLTFDNFPNLQVMPIFCYFLTVHNYCEPTQNILFDSIDKNVLSIPLSLNTIAIRVLLNQVSSNVLRPSIITFLIIAKLAFFNELSITDMRSFMQVMVSYNLTSESKTATGASLLAAACALNKLSALTASQRESLFLLCTSNAVYGAPFSLLLYEMVMNAKLDMLSMINEIDQNDFEKFEKSDEYNDSEITKFCKQSFLCQDQAPDDNNNATSYSDANEAKPENSKHEINFANAFLPLISSKRPDVRATAAHVLGITNDIIVIEHLNKVFIQDESDLVRYEACVSLNMFLKHFAILLDKEKKQNEKSEDISSNIDIDEEEIMKIIKTIRLAAENVVEIEKKKEEKAKVPYSSLSNKSPLFFLDIAEYFVDTIQSIEGNEKKNNNTTMLLESRIPELFRKSITQPGLQLRYQSNFFDFE